MQAIVFFKRDHKESSDVIALLKSRNYDVIEKPASEVWEKVDDQGEALQLVSPQLKEAPLSIIEGRYIYGFKNLEAFLNSN